MPHARQFVRVRQAPVRAEARNTTVTAPLDNPRAGDSMVDSSAPSCRYSSSRPVQIEHQPRVIREARRHAGRLVERRQLARRLRLHALYPPLDVPHRVGILGQLGRVARAEAAREIGRLLEKIAALLPEGARDGPGQVLGRAAAVSRTGRAAERWSAVSAGAIPSSSGSVLASDSSSFG